MTKNAMIKDMMIKIQGLSECKEIEDLTKKMVLLKKEISEGFLKDKIDSDHYSMIYAQLTEKYSCVAERIVLGEMYEN